MNAYEKLVAKLKNSIRDDGNYCSYYSLRNDKYFRQFFIPLNYTHSILSKDGLRNHINHQTIVINNSSILNSINLNSEDFSCTLALFAYNYTTYFLTHTHPKTKSLLYNFYSYGNFCCFGSILGMVPYRHDRPIPHPRESISHGNVHSCGK